MSLIFLRPIVGIHGDLHSQYQTEPHGSICLNKKVQRGFSECQRYLVFWYLLATIRCRFISRSPSKQKIWTLARTRFVRQPKHL